MKKRSPIWQKKRQRKFKNVKKNKNSSQIEQKQSVLPKQIIQVKKEPQGKENSLIHKLFRLREKATAEKEKKVTPPSEHTMSSLLRKYDSDIQLVLFPLILLVILITLYIVNNQFFISGVSEDPIVEYQPISLQPYPYVQAANAPDISAQAAIILDKASQVVIYAKNPQLRFSMASTTKIMTALIALDYYKPDDILTVKQGGIQGSGLNLYPGEQFRFIDLLYAMLLPSANDAAQTIADNYPGGSNSFISQMNEKAKVLHLNNTHYADAIGLNDDGDYSTVVDMARLASYAITNPTFAGITSTKYKTIYTTNFSRQYQLTNLNKLLGIDGVTGIKTGTTEGAGEVLVTSVVSRGHTYIIVVMDSVDRFYDTSKLINFIDTGVKYIVPPSPQKK